MRIKYGRYNIYLYLLIVILVSILVIYGGYYETFVADQGNRGVILMYCTQNMIDKWGHYTISMNKNYAQINNYDFVLIKDPYDDAVTHAWQKIPAMIELLESGKYDFVMYIDTDAVFNDYNKQLETIIDKYSDKDIIVCSDEANSGGKYKVNGGTIIAKNTNNSIDLLQKWWDLRYDYKEFAFEQWALSDIYENKIEHIDGSNTIAVCPEIEFNSIYSEVVEYSNRIIDGSNNIPNRYILHFMAMNDDIREQVFKRLAIIYSEKYNK